MNCWNHFGLAGLPGLSDRMRVLITGGYGLIGGRLADYLSQSGYDILLGSRRLQPPPDWLPKAVHVQTNWDDESELEKICHDVDVIIHAAGMNANECFLHPAEALASNGVATARLVAAACRMKCRNFVYLSTAHVYASPLEGLIHEDVCPRNLHPYATSHLAGEFAVLHALAQGKMSGLVLRLSNSFGQPIHRNVDCWQLLVNDLCRQAVTNGKLVLRTTGMQQRDFICLTDVCQLIDNLVFKAADRMPIGILNLGRGYSTTVLDMARIIQKRCVRVLGFAPTLEYSMASSLDQCGQLEYRIDRLLESAALTSTCNDMAEIDSLLRYCLETFR